MLWGIAGGLVLVLLVIVWVVTVIDILGRHMDRSKTAGWLLIVILLPLAGSLTWFLLRKPTEAEVEGQAEAELALRQEAHRRGFDSTRIGP